MPTHTSSKPKWWQTATFYELYPSSFKDSNSDGIGDIPGIISKIPYLASLGINAVWLAACHKSGKIDMGYDVVDYREVDRQYGTVEDLEHLIAELNRVGIKLIMDMVVNHTSDQHAWFQESRSSLTNSKRDWYIWRKGGRDDSKEDGRKQHIPPNNWESIFTGSAWTYDQGTDEWYLRIFSKEQPDLNWSNPEVREAVYDEMRFWLEKGVAGFRLDVINIISKAEDLELWNAESVNEKVFEQPAYGLYCNGPQVHEFLREMREEVLDRYSDQDERMAVGEVIVTSEPKEVRCYVEPGRKELNMVYQYDLFDVDSGLSGKFSASLTSKEDILRKVKKIVTKWQTELAFSKGGWNTVWLESHDTARSISRFGDGSSKNRCKVAKMLALLQTTLSGTLFIYQGQELGLVNLSDEISIEKYPDVETKKAWEACYRSRRLAHSAEDYSDVDMSDFEEQIRMKARDHARMPLPWTTSASSRPNAGFSDAEEGHTWSPMNTDSESCNIEQQNSDPDSVLNFWRKQISFRQKHPETLILGDFEIVSHDERLDDDDEYEVMAYWKKAILTRNESNEKAILVILNLTGNENVVFPLPPIPGGGKHDDGKLATYVWLGGTGEEGRSVNHRVLSDRSDIVLGAYEGLVLGYSKR